MKLHLDILCGKEDLKEHIPEDAKKESLEICQGYVWYLQACYDKEDDTIDEAREEMKILYENSDDISPSNETDQRIISGGMSKPSASF